MVMMSSMTSQGDLKVVPLYLCLGELGSGGKLQGQYLVNKC